MSAINQMLRDLDARRPADAEPLSPVPVAARPAGWRAGVVIAVGLLAVGGGVAAYFASGQYGHGVPQTPGASARTAVPLSSGAASTPAAAPAVQAVAQAAPQVVARVPATAPAATGAPVQAHPVRPPVLGLSLSLDVPARPVAPTPAVGSASISKVPAYSPEVEAQQLLGDAQAAQRAGRTAAALDLYRQTLQRNPALLQARLGQAMLLHDDGRNDEAIALLETGYAQRAHPALAVMMGRLLADAGRQQEALNWLARARDSLRPADHALMGALYAQLQRHDEAVEAYQRALAAEPAQGGWLLGLGVSLDALGRRDEARVAYRGALEHGSFKPEVEKFLRDRSAPPSP